MRTMRIPMLLVAVFSAVSTGLAAPPFRVLDTRQVLCYDDHKLIACPLPGQSYFGQDAQHTGMPMLYVDHGDGTVSDLHTGLMWQKEVIASISWDDAMTGAASFHLGGYNDWRLPSIKELYSLIKFDGVFGTDPSNSSPFIDTNHFEFYYAGPPRFFDVQEWSSTEYVGLTMNGDATVFGVNFADGRIKGYPKFEPGSGGTIPNRKYARYVRGNPHYGTNEFVSNGDGTITDRRSNLMWSRADSGVGLNWEEALDWVRSRNAMNYLGYSDWRMPNAKELQSLVDYTRAPDAVIPARRGPAIAPVFLITPLGNDDYPYFWASTTLLDGLVMDQPKIGVYLAFGLALGWVVDPHMPGHWELLNVHGAGSQRGDPKSGNPADPKYVHGHGPQGDEVRIINYVRLVRDVWRKGDLNCDHRVDFGDINPFVKALSDPSGYAVQFPLCDLYNADINRDGYVDFGDINAFVDLLTQP